MLPSAVQLLPTPAARDGRAAGTPEGFARRSVGHAQPLPEVVAHLLPTPSAINPNDGESLESWEARRERVKVTANNGNGMGTPLSIAVRMLPTPRTVRGGSGTETVALLPTPKATNNENRQSGGYGPNLGAALSDVTESAWGPYAAAIARWEAIHGPAPAPTKLSKKGNRKLNPAFSAWMMGAPRGWITDVPGLTDNQASHAIGNGVVPHQGAAALRVLLDRISRWTEPA